MFSNNQINIFFDVLSIIIGVIGLSFLLYTCIFSFFGIIKYYKKNRKLNIFKSKLYLTLFLASGGSAYQLFLGYWYIFSNEIKPASVMDLQFIISYMISWIIVNLLHYWIYNYDIYTYRKSKYNM